MSVRHVTLNFDFKGEGYELTTDVDASGLSDDELDCLIEQLVIQLEKRDPEGTYEETDEEDEETQVSVSPVSKRVRSKI